MPGKKTNKPVKKKNLKPIDYRKPIISKDRDIETDLDKHIFRPSGEGMKNLKR
jgi:hypothetical protein